MRQTLKRNVRRQTLQRKDLTLEQREKLQKMDGDYKLFKVSEIDVTVDEQDLNQEIQNTGQK